MPNTTYDQYIAPYNTAATSAANDAASYGSLGMTLPDQLKSIIQQKIDNNKPLVEGLANAESGYMAAPSEARTKYMANLAPTGGGAVDPFALEQLTAQSRALAYQPVSMYSNLLNQSNSSIADTIGAASNAWQGQTMMAQNKATTAQNSLNSAIDAYWRQQDQANKERQMKLEEATFNVSKGNTPAGGTAFQSAIENGIASLKTGENWGPVFDRIKSQFPQVANEQIRTQLGPEWEQAGAYEAYIQKIGKGNDAIFKAIDKLPDNQHYDPTTGNILEKSGGIMGSGIMTSDRIVGNLGKLSITGNQPNNQTNTQNSETEKAFIKSEASKIPLVQRRNYIQAQGFDPNDSYFAGVLRKE